MQRAVGIQKLRGQRGLHAALPDGVVPCGIHKLQVSRQIRQIRPAQEHPQRQHRRPCQPQHVVDQPAAQLFFPFHHWSVPPVVPPKCRRTVIRNIITQQPDFANAPVQRGISSREQPLKAANFSSRFSTAAESARPGVFPSSYQMWRTCSVSAARSGTASTRPTKFSP